MKIFFIGDIVGDTGVDFVCAHLDSVRKLKGIDFVIANGENSSASGKGISKDAARRLFMCGVNVITMGNHTFNNKDVVRLMEDSDIIRPANFPPAVPGEGYIEKGEIAVINVNGRVYMNSMDCPFRTTERILERLSAKTVIVDFHGEATSEKRAFAEYFDGRVSAVIGTHTHVQTADERILKNGTAFISDVGMTGPEDSVLGVRKDEVLRMFLTGLPVRFCVAGGETVLSGVIVETDENGKALSVERFNMK